MKKLNLILLVDDDPTSNFLNKRLLQDLQMTEEIKVLTNGKMALDYMLENCHSSAKACPQLIILDHHMPLMDGLELMIALHQSGILAKRQIVFLLLAIDTRQEDKEAFRRLGVQEFTSKPLSKKTVLDAYKKYWVGDTAKKHLNN